MQYEILRTNDNNTATVAMTISGQVLNQDFDLGTSQTDLVANIEAGMAVFQSELDRNAQAQTYTPTIGKPEAVATLPTIPVADLLPVQPDPTPTVS